MVIIAAAVLSVVQVARQAAADLLLAGMPTLSIADAAAGLWPSSGQTFGRMPADVCAHFLHMVGAEATHQTEEFRLAIFLVVEPTEIFLVAFVRPT